MKLLFGIFALTLCACVISEESEPPGDSGEPSKPQDPPFVLTDSSKEQDPCASIFLEKELFGSDYLLEIPVECHLLLDPSLPVEEIVNPMLEKQDPVEYQLDPSLNSSNWI